MNAKLRRTGAGMGAVVLMLCGASSAWAAKNTDFRGTWGSAQPGGWTVTYENFKTGVCRGRTYYGPGYGFTACRVRGDRYTFTITFTGGYRSVNQGTIHGNVLRGSFHDTNGTTQSYTVRRVSKR